MARLAERGRGQPADGLQRDRHQARAGRGDDPRASSTGSSRVVERAFDAHPDDLVRAIERASRDVLELAQDNPLLHAVVSATHGADTELLPLLTTHADSLLGVAKAVVGERRGAVRPRARRRPTSTPPSTWSSGSCSATSCSRPARRSRPPPTSPGVGQAAGASAT